MYTVVLLECSNCKRRNYSTSKPEKRKTDKLVLRKYCSTCRSHHEHKETKK